LTLKIWLLFIPQEVTAVGKALTVEIKIDIECRARVTAAKKKEET
jgi:hypothetical protein